MSTTISIIDATSTDLDLNTSVSPSLDSADWSILNSVVPATSSAVNILEFNRNEGISRGKTWIFTTAFSIDGVDVELQEKLEGTLLGSTMYQSMTAGTVSTGWQDTNDSKSITFSGASGTEYSLTWDLSSVGYKNIQYTLKVTKPAYKPTTPVMPQIKNVIYLMLENRSLDNVLGWLYSSGKPSIVYPAGSSSDFDGIPTDASNNYEGTKYSPAQGTAGFSEPCRVPDYDPYEPMDHVKIQLYADGNGNMPSGDFWSQNPKMTGFAYDYHAFYESEPGQVMGAYNEDQLPVLYGLAKNFAVSDRWFCSVPTQTDPNRAFSVCGTSLGAEQNSDIDKDTYANTNTIFNALGDNGKTWGMYWQSDDPIATGEPVIGFGPFTSYYFSKMNDAPNGSVQKYSDFFTELQEGKLPEFSFLEPFWGGGMGDAYLQGNDYHPPAWIGPAEADLNTLYEAITSSPQWKDTLFVITFDEHGGTYDHVAPTEGIRPDDSVGSSGFTFDRLGVRVPTILISPYIQSGTVFRAPDGSKQDFDHTSFIATMLKWAGVDPASASLGARVASAPTFEDVLSDTARSDIPQFTVPSDYKDQGGGTGHLNVLEVGDAKKTLDIRDFRDAVDESKSVDELNQRLKDLKSLK